eukprot:gnl/TRDRNA2_/TRDRNA2_170022_c0_seq1.p1 gnl/TRDRNA2_/TRDRNA2_170022_c0~~gnl/TRDRNA2_/TRDRNA2_170022_c0_seq1.p1  ORF type:complete len:637 (+),score=142.98 gnl/TRDRNA2_/TRDRNA2_170022_c0_seq1:126-1913(+)
MEDAHIIHMRDTWAFFGVFDGHGGDQCSAFIERRLTEELVAMSEPPADDAAVKDLALRLDAEFLETKQPSGSTGTFVIVKPPPPEDAGGKFLLRVGNIGDSRVLLARADGSLVEGPGTDGGLTTDHKPDHPGEAARIARTGGTIETIMGVARVNGDLAVSRSFGDGRHKETGGPAQEDHPVSAEPEFTTLECDPTDFVMLVCDGISEKDFPNRDVAKVAAEKLRLTSSESSAVDTGAAAAAVCQMALRQGSQDNLSCMIVLLEGGALAGAAKELLPGPFDCPSHGGFRKAYAAMAGHAGLTLAQAVEARYDMAQQQLEDAAKSPTTDVNLQALREEMGPFLDGPPSELEVGSAERTQWFSEWLEYQHQGESDDEDRPMTTDELLDMLDSNPHLREMARARGINVDRVTRPVQVQPVEPLRKALEAHPALKWDDRMAEMAGQAAFVLNDDESDGTSRVRFPPPLDHTVWLPTSTLIDLTGRSVEVLAVEKVKAAVEAHKSLRWVDDMEELCGQRGMALVDDESDATTRVMFPPPLGCIAWLPTCGLADVGKEECNEEATGNEKEEESAGAKKRPLEVVDGEGDKEPEEKRQHTEAD